VAYTYIECLTLAQHTNRSDQNISLWFSLCVINSHVLSPRPYSLSTYFNLVETWYRDKPQFAELLWA